MAELGVGVIVIDRQLEYPLVVFFSKEHADRVQYIIHGDGKGFYALTATGRESLKNSLPLPVCHR